jgi:hypothetical protein
MLISDLEKSTRPEVITTRIPEASVMAPSTLLKPQLSFVILVFILSMSSPGFLSWFCVTIQVLKEHHSKATFYLSSKYLKNEKTSHRDGTLARLWRIWHLPWDPNFLHIQHFAVSWDQSNKLICQESERGSRPTSAVSTHWEDAPIMQTQMCICATKHHLHNENKWQHAKERKVCLWSKWFSGK